MSRDLKFRAWDKTAKQYYDVVDLGVGPHTWQRTAKNLLNQPFEPDTGKQKFYPTEVIVEQYTGLKDKHGKEIYEGDILDLAGADEDNAEVVANNGFFALRFASGVFLTSITDTTPEKIEFILALGQLNTELFEVIGNIHEGVKND